MRKVMLTATILTLTACAGVEQSNGGPSGDDTGDMGSGSETDAGKLTIDGSDFIDDGTTLWSTTNAPQLKGTFEASGPVTITVQAGAQAAVTATLAGTQWSVKLPADSITSSNVSVTVTMTAMSGAKTELSRLFGLDSAPPAITVLPSIVRDERGDQIDFASGEPVHTHAGPQIDLASGTCPSVYKYAYLMGAPMFGSATSPNELAWKIRIADAKLKVDSEQYRVRSEDGTTLVSWTAMPAADAMGISTVKLDRTAVPLIGTRTGKFYVDVRASDLTDLQTTSTLCFDNHPLAAPLRVEPLQTASNGITSWSFAADSPISQLMDTAGGALIAQQRIVQHTNEPILVRAETSVASLGFGRTYAIGYVKFGQKKINTDLAGSISAPASLSTVGGETQQYSLFTTVYDDTSNTMLFPDFAGNITIPARSASEAPHAYRVEVHLNQVGALRPTPSAAVGEYTAAGKSYTGLAPNDTQYVCDEATVSCVHLTCTCTADVYVNTTALNHLALGIETPSVTLKTAASANAALDTSSTSTSPNVVWDAGNEFGL